MGCEVADRDGGPLTGPLCANHTKPPERAIPPGYPRAHTAHMKGTVVATTTLLVLALGGTPTAALVLDNDTPDSTAPTSQSRPDRTQSAQPGPPAWAAGEGRAKQGDKHAGQLKGWAKHRADKPGKAGKAGKAGNGHGRAVRAWAHCVADFNREQGGPDTGGSRAAAGVCGEKPLSPGQTKAKAESEIPRQGPGGADRSSPAR